jgi:hypothetical protein
MRKLQTIVAICAAAALPWGSAPSAHASFGFQSTTFSVDSAPAAGAEPGVVGPPQVQAGSHPYRMKIAFAFNQTTDPFGEAAPDGTAKDLQIDLPPGLIGSPVEIPRCPPEAFEDSSFFNQGCAAATQVGTLALDTTFLDTTFPVFNLEPPPEVAAQLGVFAVVTPVSMGISIRTGDDYGLTVNLRNLPQFLPTLEGSLNLWGVPADERHDTLRGSCLGLFGESLGRCPSSAPRRPFLTLPGSCMGPPRATLRADSWERPGVFAVGTAVPRDGDGNPLGLRDCDALDFSPSVDVRSESRAADTPSGFAVDLHVPQSENPDGLAEADVRRAVVALPQGVSIDPAAADGLSGCLQREIGLDDATEPRCPDSSRIGSMTIESPLIAEPLQGPVYLAAPHENAFGSMFAAYFTAERDGILIKLAGRVEADPETGQLTVTLDGMPQLPFSEMTLAFDGGPRAPLATPSRCGSSTVTTRLTSHSDPEAAAQATPASSFVIDRDCDTGFSPSFSGGATSSLAGRRTSLALRFSRADGEQAIRGFTTALPRGMLPLLGSVPPCAETEAATGSCGPSSRIGSIAIAAGAGPHPFHFLGKVSLTGPYGDAPFGLSIAVPGTTGPFDLGTIVVRARVSVDPHDARVTIATDPLPRILQGIPLRIRGFDLTSSDRPGFFLAPTSCEGQRVAATALGGAGATVSLSSPFFLAGCAGLRFSPRISASAGARVTRAGGVDLEFAVRNPRGAQSNIRAISVDFPHRLSPRLSTIQAACAQAVFAADPAACPRPSAVGRATVRTPILDLPLRGPAYLVSRGGEALPRIVLLPQARGVVLRIVGSLRIGDNGTTTATFASIPDAPISSFMLSLSRGPHSALGANFLGEAAGNLCAHNLAMPTEVVAQNGSRVRRPVEVSVAGCAKSPTRSSGRCAARCGASPAARRRAAASNR